EDVVEALRRRPMWVDVRMRVDERDSADLGEQVSDESILNGHGGRPPTRRIVRSDRLVEGFTRFTPAGQRRRRDRTFFRDPIFLRTSRRPNDLRDRNAQPTARRTLLARPVLWILSQPDTRSRPPRGRIRPGARIKGPALRPHRGAGPPP